MALTQSQFCAILSRLSEHQSGVREAVESSAYGLNRLQGALKLARRNVEAEVRGAVPTGLLLPVDTNLYTQLIAACPGLLPPLPKDAAQAALAISALQALIQSDSPAGLLNTMTGDPFGRLQRINSTLNGVVKLVQGIADGSRNGTELKIPGAGDVGKSLTKIVTDEATSLASKALSDALAKVGLDPRAALRCSRRLCATGSFNPPG